MVKNMSSDFTAFADARGPLIGPRLVLPASFTLISGIRVWTQRPLRMGQLSECSVIRSATRRIDG